MEGMAEILVAVSYLLVTLCASIALLFLVRLADRYEPEPWHVLLLAMAWGAVPAILLSCLMEATVQGPLSMVAGENAAAVTGTIVVAPVVEEVVKGLALLLVFVLFRLEFDDVLDGMVYGAAVGIGFSFVEDALYFVGALGDAGWSGGVIVFFLRNVGFILNHSLFTALTGIGFGLARIFHKSLAARFLWPLAGLGAAVALHALHNFLAHFDLPGLTAALIVHWGGGLGLLCLLPPLWALERRWILQRLHGEISQERIPPAVAGALPFSGFRSKTMPYATARRLRPLLVRLAFRLRQREEGWADPGDRILDDLRGKIRAFFSDQVED